MNVERAQYLLDSVPRSELEGLDPFGWTWLHCTVFNDQPDVLDILLGHRFDPNIRSRTGETVMELAIRLERCKCIAVLKNYSR